MHDLQTFHIFYVTSTRISILEVHYISICVTYGKWGIIVVEPPTVRLLPLFCFILCAVRSSLNCYAFVFTRNTSVRFVFEGEGGRGNASLDQVSPTRRRSVGRYKDRSPLLPVRRPLRIKYNFYASDYFTHFLWYDFSSYQGWLLKDKGILIFYHTGSEVRLYNLSGKSTLTHLWQWAICWSRLQLNAYRNSLHRCIYFRILFVTETYIFDL